MGSYFFYRVRSTLLVQFKVSSKIVNPPFFNSAITFIHCCVSQTQLNHKMKNSYVITIPRGDDIQIKPLDGVKNGKQRLNLEKSTCGNTISN